MPEKAGETCVICGKRLDAGIPYSMVFDGKDNYHRVCFDKAGKRLPWERVPQGEAGRD